VSPELDESWRAAMVDRFDDARIEGILARVQAEADAGKNIYPPRAQIFAALNHTKLPDVRVVILGQDPYIRPGQAHGFAFSVPRGVRKPPSLRNVLKELATDLGCAEPGHGCLEAWADQGVLLLNTILTVEEGKSGSHGKFGWEEFTDRVIEAVSARRERVVFLLWGAKASEKAALIDAEKHLVLVAAHPSPLARGKFFHSRPFSQANADLRARHLAEIDWRLPD
jgi:uracil-DNA glycosylase